MASMPNTDNWLMEYSENKQHTSNTMNGVSFRALIPIQFIAAIFIVVFSDYQVHSFGSSHHKQPWIPMTNQWISKPWISPLLRRQAAKASKVAISAWAKWWMGFFGLGKFVKPDMGNPSWKNIKHPKNGPNMSQWNVDCPYFLPWYTMLSVRVCLILGINPSWKKQSLSKLEHFRWFFCYFKKWIFQFNVSGFHIPSPI